MIIVRRWRVWIFKSYLIILYFNFYLFFQWVANVEQQISAKLEKDPYTKRMAEQQTITLTERSAVEKASIFFGSAFTAVTMYLVTVFIINAIFGYDDAWG